MDTFAVHSERPEHTEALGRTLAALTPGGSTLALYGDMGSGKTCFVRGFAGAVAPDAQVTSPTFTLVQEYRGARTVYHLDLYRISDGVEVLDLGFEEFAADPEGICLVEWAERAENVLPEDCVDLHFSHAGLSQRLIRVTDRGRLPADWHARLQTALRDAGVPAGG